ncbi:MAG TPA: peptidyl-prolyl cis-trans isomerase [Firmicutes bacterium]|nr:peptidyl-prolyl cis-trans isomerase [Bacillota bacterium]
MEKKSNITVEMITQYGAIKAELFTKEAPETVENFLAYVRDGFYDGTLFHRVIPGFVIQGGGLDEKGEQKKTREPVRNEAANGLKNERGTLAMARTSVVDSATSQFFINLSDNQFLDHKDNTGAGFGYCVFGMVTHGMDVVDRIAALPTGDRPPHRDFPLENVILRGVKICS